MAMTSAESVVPVTTDEATLKSQHGLSRSVTYTLLSNPAAIHIPCLRREFDRQLRYRRIPRVLPIVLV